MSNRRLTAVWDDSKQNGVGLIVMLSMADQAADDGCCWPSHRFVAQRARSTPKYIAEEVLPKAQRDGEIIIYQRPGTSNLYFVIVGMSDTEVVEALQARLNLSENQAIEILEGVRSTGGGSPRKTGGGVSALQGGSPPAGQGVNHKEPKEKPKETISPSVSGDDWPDDWAAQAIEILTDDEDDDDFVEEVQYVKDPFGNDEDVDKPIVPKWRDPLNYNWQYDELMLAGLKACGRKKFGTKKEWSAWRDIDKTMIPLGLIPKEENKYPLEWIVFAIDWAAKKNKTNVTGQGNFAVRIKFPALLSLIKNEAKKNDFIRQWLDSDSVEEMEKNITVEAVTENPFADRL